MPKLDKLKEKLKYVEDRLIRYLTDESDDINGYFQLECASCKKTECELFMQKQTGETYCRECLIYETND